VLFDQGAVFGDRLVVLLLGCQGLAQIVAHRVIHLGGGVFGQKFPAGGGQFRLLLLLMEPGDPDEILERIVAGAERFRDAQSQGEGGEREDGKDTDFHVGDG